MANIITCTVYVVRYIVYHARHIVQHYSKSRIS